MKSILLSDSFVELRSGNNIYVDKTNEIYKIISSYSRIFFSRPRRFGKSLTLDTIATLFGLGKDPYFKGTFIYDKWNEPTYPILRINFLDYISSDYESFLSGLKNQILKFAAKNSFSIDPIIDTPAGYIKALFEAMPIGKQIVVLIDEYDCLLTRNINNKDQYDKFSETLKSLYASLKGGGHIRFLAVTGVTRLKHVALFSVGSDIIDLTYKNLCSNIVGYTKEEIKEYFKDYIDDVILKLYGKDISLLQKDDPVRIDYVDRLVNNLAMEYDGYCFDEDFENKVFSTWSINNFFKESFNREKIKFGDYWFDNGGIPSILKNYLDNHELDVTEYSNKDIYISHESFSNPNSLLDINPTVLMCQTGYLTLHSELELGKNIVLGIPNNEIRKALSNLLYYKTFGIEPSISNIQINSLIEGNAEEIVSLFNAILNSISYDKYPIKDESSLRSHIQMYLQGAGLNILSESNSSKGRSDLQIEFDSSRIVIEFKYAKSASDLKLLLEQASEQIIKKHYGDTLPLKDRVIKIAMVFDSKERSISVYRVIK